MYLNKKQQFGALIRSIRKKQNMTQRELGDGIYKVALISRIEQGKFCMGIIADETKGS